MANFFYGKLAMGVAPTIAKETIISKVANMINIFRITLSEGYDDNYLKYVKTINKIDNSKPIILETRGEDHRVKNIYQIDLSKEKEFLIEFSEFAQEGMNKIYVDCPYIGELPKGTKILFEQSNVEMEVLDTNEDIAKVKITKGGTIIQFDRVKINYKPFSKENYLSSKDKKDLLRGAEQEIYIYGLSNVEKVEDILETKYFLEQNNIENYRLLAKIENKDAIENFEKILDEVDGIIFVVDKIENKLKEMKIKLEDLIKKTKDNAKPVIITYVHGINSDKYPLIQQDTIEYFSNLGVDVFMLETMIVEDAPLTLVPKLFGLLQSNTIKNTLTEKKFYKDNEKQIQDYIIYLGTKAVEEIGIKAVICYTETGYTPARLTSIISERPIIAFTKDEVTFKFINLLQGTKSYKISQSFNYENLKKIGKEILRILFKGSISLENKILVINVNENENSNSTDIINQLEIYKFKNI